MTESSEQNPGWTTMKCGTCDGKGMVSGYTSFGTDFSGPEECCDCNNGEIYVSPSGRLALYPGGPFVGSLTAKERAALPSSAVTV